jgi:hypothetical protein
VPQLAWHRGVARLASFILFYSTLASVLILAILLLVFGQSALLLGTALQSQPTPKTFFAEAV